MGFLVSIPSLITLLAAAASLLALLLFRESLGSKALPGCGAGAACDEVTSSRWARWGPVPVAGPGLAACLSSLPASIPINPLSPAASQRIVCPQTNIAHMNAQRDFASDLGRA